MKVINVPYSITDFSEYELRRLCLKLGIRANMYVFIPYLNEDGEEIYVSAFVRSMHLVPVNLPGEPGEVGCSLQAVCAQLTANEDGAVEATGFTFVTDMFDRFLPLNAIPVQEWLEVQREFLGATTPM